jgi:hypothetical protein
MPTGCCSACGCRSKQQQDKIYDMIHV